MATVIREESVIRTSVAKPHEEYLQEMTFHDALKWLLPYPVRAHGGRVEQLQEPLHETEAAFVRNAVERRVMEFTAGRCCARAALDQLGIPGVAVAMGARNEPVWPTGAVGSISHAAGYCIAAVVPREHVAGLGVDIESGCALPESLIAMVCTPRERAWCENHATLSAGQLAKILFSAKESVFKCLYPLFREELEFEDVSLEPDLEHASFVAHVPGSALGVESGLVLRGRLASTAQLVMSAAMLHHVQVEWRGIGRASRTAEGCEGRYICN